MNHIVAMKNYGFAWHTVFGLSEVDAASRMADQGIDWVVVQNLIDPVPTSAVDQAPPPATYSDLRFRDALRRQGIRVFEASAVFFRPDALDADPSLRPIGVDGRPMERLGWYVGLCPTSPTYLASRMEVAERVASELQPDGLFLVFIRFPGFWEDWMPETTRADIAEHCCCDRCLERFQRDTGLWLPEGSVQERAAVLTHELRDAWTGWKCDVIAGVVRDLRTAARRGQPDAEVWLNGAGFGRSDYGDAVEQVLGQDLDKLGRVADDLELMFYHQIQRREPAPWIASLVAEARPRFPGKLLACLQTKPDYLDGIYAWARRRPEIPLGEHLDALRAVARSQADGVMVYLWSDYLEDEARGGGLTEALRRFKAGDI
ncbi:MAG: hypothetical protein U0667_04535 [Chloroflexota bacterium]